MQGIRGIANWTGLAHAGFVSLGLLAFTTEITLAASGLAPHRAVYDMELEEVDESSGIAALTGLMVYDFSGNACDGYSITFRFVTEFTGHDGGTQVTDLRSSSHETGDGGRFEFLSKTFVDQKLVEETRGAAQSKGERKSVSLQEPAEKTLEIDGATLFPTVHLQKIIAAAQAGERFLAADVFDGSETGDKVYATATVIGDTKNGPPSLDHKSKTSVTDAMSVSYWPVTIAYFDPADNGNGEQTPVYQLSFLLSENGISRQLSLDYGDFAIRGSLRDLELHDETGCTN